MYFYNSLILISNILILTLHTRSQNTIGAGSSVCLYFDGKDTCGLPEVKVEELPKECSSIAFNGVFIDLKYKITSFNAGQDTKQSIDILDIVLKNSKPVYLYYGHPTYEEWTALLTNETCTDGKNSLEEMKALKVFFDEHPRITGLIITGFEYKNDPVEFPGYSENLKKYLEVMKTTFPSLEIGIEFYGPFLIFQSTTPDIPWLDIGIIAPAVDFFVISLFYMNDCTDDLIYTGIDPMTSSTAGYTMDQIKTIVTKAPFPKEKTIFKFLLDPISRPDDSLTSCNTTIDQVCLHPSETCSWCLSPQTSFNEKGKFSKEYGAGFMADAIDLNDPRNLCKCENPYPSFYAILDGYNGVTSKICDLLIRK